MDTSLKFLNDVNDIGLASVVNTAPNVRGWKGEDIRLRCDIQEEPFAVFWVMESTSMSQLQRKMTMASFIDGNFDSVDERFDIDKNFSLVIADLTVADEGRYYCQVVLQNLENFENSTFLTISSMPSKHVIEECGGQRCGWNPCWRTPHHPWRFDEEEQFMLKPSSSSLSLTEKQVQQCKEELKAYYRMSRRKVTVDPLNFMERVELDEIYTNLSLIDKSSTRSTPLTYDDLLSSDENGNLSKRLLVQGEGGAGKTTLCAKIAWDWCQERILQDLDMVLVIPLRDVTDFKSIGGIVKKFLSDSNTAIVKQIEDYISKHPNKILLVFDGFDEFKWKLSEKNSSEIIRILGCEQYKSCKVIVTTRPWRTNEFRIEKSLAEAYTFITVEGLNKENVSTYVRRYFRIREKDALAESLISFMEENDVIRSNMAPFPIYCAMLCLMWNDFSDERRKEMQTLKTFSKIFGEMISFLKEHYASKICENSHRPNAVAHLEEADRAIQDISEIALNGLFDRNLSFPEEQFSECRDAMETCCRVGVLTVEQDVISRKRRRDVNVPSFVVTTVSFPHKLFQEYVAGLYIADVYASDTAKYDRLKDKLLPRFEEFRYLFYFSSASRNELGLDIISGMINYPPNNLTSYSEPGSLLGKEHEIRDFCVDVAFECHTEEAIRAVGKRWEKYKLSSSTTMSEHTNAGVVFMVHCNQVLSLSTSVMNCGRSMSRDLAEGMCSSSVLREVSMWISRFHTDFYKILGEKASNCQVRELYVWIYEGWGSGSASAVKFAQYIGHLPHLELCDIKCDDLPEIFFQTIASQATCCTLERITINERPLNELISDNQ
ncbi:NLR family CARD domain-containing protein 4-like [Diadema setosum]|uniref:NLR family CARD domain-containing protein 4-like n=1 Tax=Diadema setosum TaxID=31175 RepID=UPI003B3AD76D